MGCLNSKEKDSFNLKKKSHIREKHVNVISIKQRIKNEWDVADTSKNGTLSFQGLDFCFYLDLTN